MIRRVEFDALLVDAGARSGRRARRAAPTSCGRRRLTTASCSMARDGRRFEAPIVIAADGVHSIVARRLGLNPGWPASSVALDMMEETPRDDAAGRRSLDAVGGLRLRSRRTERATSGVRARDQPASSGQAPKGMPTSFPSAITSTSASATCSITIGASIDAPPYELQRGFVDHLRAAACGGRIGATQLHAVHHSGRRSAAAAGPWPRAAGRRCRRLRQRLHRGGHLLRDGLRRSCRRAVVATPPSGVRGAGVDDTSGRATREIGAELRDSVLIQRYLFGDRRRIARVIEGARTSRR